MNSPMCDDVEQAAALAHGLVLGGDALWVLDGHLVAGEGNDLRAEGDVVVVEGRALERARRQSWDGGHA